ncbi:hypothetical protein ABB02_01618 [Clostridiaceae bacterium JG1575]|nr:hypothetical protein ABB02_01618 [Clostridiaceae bacterium JG1575]
MNFTNSLILNILLTIIYAMVVMIGFNLANIYFLRKKRPNHWLMLGIAVALFAGALVLLAYFPKALWHLIPLTVSLFAFLWFIDLKRRPAPKNVDKPIVRKPKAKPNRARTLQQKDSKSSSRPS